MAIEKVADLSWKRCRANRCVRRAFGAKPDQLGAAYGRIMDADIALESTRMARQNVLVQSSAAMVAQANQLTNIALTVLG